MEYIKNHALIGLVLLVFLLAAGVARAQEMYRPNDQNREARQIMFKLPFSTTRQLIDVEIVAGKIIFEGDIILGDAAMLAAPQLMAAGTNDKRWPNGIIPYDVKTSHPKYSDIMTAIDTVNRKTNLSFIKRTTETDYVEYVNGDGCSSFFGKKGGRQEVVIGDCTIGNAIHESLHVGGLYHEQSRSDRDSFVTIKWDNIEDGKEKNFTKYKESKVEIFNGSDIGEYDYGSIMHYGTHFFSKNKEATIVPTKEVEIGQRDHISVGDIRGIRVMYPTKAIVPSADTYRKTPDMVQTKPGASRADTYRPRGIVKP